MPDISLCKNESCRLRSKCYRYLAVPTPYRQSYADFKQDEGGICWAFRPVPVGAPTVQHPEEVSP